MQKARNLRGEAYSSACASCCLIFLLCLNVCATADVIARIPPPPPDQYNLLFSCLTIRWHAVLAFGVHACTDATVTHLSTHHSLCRNNLVTIATQSAPHHWMDRSEQAPSLFSLSLQIARAEKPGWPRPLNTFRSGCSHAPVIL